MAPSYRTWQNPPVAKKTMIEGFTPTAAKSRRPHLVAVVAFDGVVLGDLSTACEVFGLAKRKDGRTGYEVRVCSESADVESHRSRTHLGLEKDAPDPRPISLPSAGPIIAIPEIGGLHHRYERQAA
jgi:hypothetical protein